MPAYDYRCQTCSSEFEVQMSIPHKESGQAVSCPTCESTATKHLYRPAAMVSQSRNPDPHCRHAMTGSCCAAASGCGCGPV